MFKVGSLYAGVGGICLGFKNARFKINWANEYDKNACITFLDFLLLPFYLVVIFFILP